VNYGPDQVDVPFDGTNGRRLVLSSDGSESTITIVQDNKIRQISLTNNDGSGKEQLFDPDNTHPYKELDVAKDANNKITGAQVVLDQNIINAGGSIGQIFGSALGSALGGKDQLSKLTSSVVGGTIGSLIGQKFGLVVATSMAADLSKVSLADVFAGQNLDISSAGIGAVSSFLTAELGNALQIPGFGGQLFNAATNGFTLSVLSQVKAGIGAGLTFDAAISAIDWSAAVSGAIDATGLNVGNLLGTFLGQLLVPAKSHAGAIGGQLLGAIGSNLLLERGHQAVIHASRGANARRHFRGSGLAPCERSGCQHGLHSQKVCVIGDLVHKTRVTKIHTQFVHDADRVQLIGLHGTRESFMGRNSIRGCARQEILQSRPAELRTPMLSRNWPGRETGGLAISSSGHFQISTSATARSAACCGRGMSRRRG
jgi:hypothetical protein